MTITLGECAQWAFICLSASAAAGGFVLLGVGITTLARDDWQLVQLLDAALYPAVGVVLTVIGVLVAALGVLAARGARTETSLLLKLFFWATLALLVAAGIAMVVAFAVGAQTVLEDVRGGMLKSLVRWRRDEDVRRLWDDMQGGFQCCGVDGAVDWAPVMGRNQVPDSCCRQDLPLPGRCTAISGSYNVGCVWKMSGVVSTYSAVIGGTSAAVAVVLLVAMVASYAVIKSSEDPSGYMALSCTAGSSGT